MSRKTNAKVLIIEDTLSMALLYERSLKKEGIVFGIANKDNSLLPSGEAFKTFNTQFLNQNLETE